MEPLEEILHEIAAFENQLSRRTFIGAALLIAVVPNTSLGKDNHRFLDAVAATLIPSTALQSTGISVAQNVELLLRNGSADHRRKVTRLYTQRILSPVIAALPNLTKQYEPVFTRLAVVKVSLRLASP